MAAAIATSEQEQVNLDLGMDSSALRRAIVAGGIWLAVLGAWTLAQSDAGTEARLALQSRFSIDRPAVMPPELPAEWRWNRPVVKFDDMYMNRGSSRRVDWIRDSTSIDYRAGGR
ncbi:MAG: hypothetical protein AB8G23_05770 [Myxococcota bacterium]